MRKNDPKFPFAVYRTTSSDRVVNSICRDREMEIVEVIDGRVEIQIGTELAEASCGDIVCVPPR